MTTGTIEKLQAYRDNPAISQSEIKALLNGKSIGKKPSLTMLLGSYLDCVLLTPEIKDDLYYVCDVERPTPKIEEMCESFYKWIEGDALLREGYEWVPVLEEHLDEIQQWIDTQDYYNNRPNTRVDKFINEAKEWWEVLVQKGEREIITTIEDIETELLCIRLKRDLTLSWLWKGEFQKDFYWTEEGIDCKGLGDIVHPSVYVDLKYTTCSNIKDWIKVACSLNYPFQMAFYKSGLKVDKCKWLVVNKDWHELVNVTNLMLQIGKWGYSKREVIQIGKVETLLDKKTYGYMDGLALIKGQQEKTIEQLYLENL